ncbi:hypothetical protein [Pseudonocardia parietis]|uniref:Uncharacterized protein n=1 Tax=Pseudonocardia parietis TaxID=570936 RepID=A0ABS4VTT7_9PSEU|nr:hypothetical protein [Pseudonocardia parietis]MBP2367336.1 hypothetical protein [Pseudonocardia parietis]
MAPRTRTPSATDWVRPWLQLTEIAVTAPWVIGYRTVALLSGGVPPGAAARREYTRMWTEKIEAFTRAGVVAATTVPGPAAAGRALTPVRDRVRRNARRLAR